MLKLNNRTDLDNKVVEWFFNIWILKEFIHDDKFEKYYGTFLDENGDFSENKIKWKLEEIFNLISNYDVTTDNPNRFWPLNDKEKYNKIEYILNKDLDEYESWWEFSDELNIQIKEWEIEMLVEDEIGILNMKNREDNINIIKNWLIWYLEKLYEKLPYNISTKKAIDEMVKKIIEIIKK